MQNYKKAIMRYFNRINNYNPYIMQKYSKQRMKKHYIKQMRKTKDWMNS